MDADQLPDSPSAGLECHHAWRATFSLSSLLLWTTLLAILMGVGKIAPEFGIVLAFLSIPAGLNTAGLAAYCRQKSGRTMTAPEKAGAFAIFVGAFVFIGVTIVIAAAMALLAGEMTAHTGMVRSWASGGVVALLAFGVAMIPVVWLAYRILHGIWQGLG